MREHSGAPDTAVGPECEEPAGTLNSASEAHSSVRGHSVWRDGDLAIPPLRSRDDRDSHGETHHPFPSPLTCVQGLPDATASSAGSSAGSQGVTLLR